MNISSELQSYCYNLINELARVFNTVLTSGFEYELGFDKVMSILGVPDKPRSAILWTSKHHADISGIPYKKLSPVNQFLITALPYIWYCLINKPPADLDKEKVHELLNSDEFGDFIRRLSEKVSQEVKGALWKPF